MRRGLRLAAAVLWVYAALVWARLPAGAVHLVLEEPLTAARVQDHADREELALCFWGQAGTADLTCHQTGAAAQASWMVLAGNPSVLGADVLAWQEGCLVDEDTARTLFGTASCSGQELELGGRTWRVLGTVQAWQETVMTLAQPENGAVLDYCALTAGEDGQAFLIRRGLTGTVLEDGFLRALNANILLLSPGLVLLALLRRSLGRSREALGRRDGRSLARWGLCLALTAAGLLALLTKCTIPADAVPSRWSDFSFWGALLTRRRQALADLFLLAREPGHLQILLDMLKSTGTATLSALLLARMAGGGRGG